MNTDVSATDAIIERFSSEIGGVEPAWAIKNRPDGEYLLFEFAHPNDRLHAALDRALQAVGEENEYRERVAIVKRKRKPANVVEIAEARLLQKELSESLTVDRNTFGDDFLSRYTSSVTNHEQSIVGKANHVVYGRRGSGKSSLLAYAMHRIAASGLPFSWIALQTYAGRDEPQVIASVIAEIFFELSSQSNDSADFKSLADRFDLLAESSKENIDLDIDRLLPRARRTLSTLASSEKPIIIFLDDIHVVAQSLQPRLLGAIYAMARGNNCFIKASGIEHFTNIWDSSTRTGLESPHDAQILKLDYNLTMPDRSREHIVSILDAHAQFCGLPGVRYLCEDQVLSRLVLVAAAVPRDALSLFSQAITKSLVKGQKAVTIMSINAAASETVEEKLRDVEKDISANEREGLQSTLDKIRDLCVKTYGVNSFLVRIDNRNAAYQAVQKLIALRFIHVLHEGITPHKVGERYIALMLDFGFYIGARAAKSVRLFPEKPKPLAAKDLRTLPIFQWSDLVEGPSVAAVKKSAKKVSKRKRTTASKKSAQR